MSFLKDILPTGLSPLIHLRVLTTQGKHAGIGNITCVNNSTFPIMREGARGMIFRPRVQFMSSSQEFCQPLSVSR